MLSFLLFWKLELFPTADSSINNEVFPCEVLETPNKDVQRVAKNFVQNYNKSKFENGSRRTNKKSKIGKVNLENTINIEVITL